jgi:Phosphoinositide phospholipase C, Ca2+-dependent
MGDGGAGTGGAGGGSGGGPVDPPPPPDPESLVQLNHLQFWGTHNSYHLQPLIPFDASHRYSHAPLREQAELWGVRAFEIDLHDGGDEIEVYHIQIIDSRTTCDTLTECLQQLRGWSDDSPGHLPVVVWFEAKDESITGPTLDNLDLVDETVRREMGDRTFTPDDLKGSHASPREALDMEGWPSLATMRGKFLFAVLNNDELTRAYSRDFTSLDGRMLFIKAERDQYDLPWAAVTKINNPEEADGIREALARELLVASNTCGAGSAADECQREREAAVRNGTTTFHDDFEADYQPFGPGRIVGCSPITAPPECELLDLSGP